jgi:hypothetical protein
VTLKIKIKKNPYVSKASVLNPNELIHEKTIRKARCFMARWKAAPVRH